MTEGKQKMEDYKSNILYSRSKENPIIADRFYSINLTILNTFEQLKIKTKVSTLRNRR